MSSVFVSFCFIKSVSGSEKYLTGSALYRPNDTDNEFNELIYKGYMEAQGSLVLPFEKGSIVLMVGRSIPKKRSLIWSNQHQFSPIRLMMTPNLAQKIFQMPYRYWYTQHRQFKPPILPKKQPKEKVSFCQENYTTVLPATRILIRKSSCHTLIHTIGMTRWKTT